MLHPTPSLTCYVYIIIVILTIVVLTILVGFACLFLCLLSCALILILILTLRKQAHLEGLVGLCYRQHFVTMVDTTELTKWAQ